MTLETIYYITQIFAVLAVIGSLLFVGIQIRDNSRAVKDQNRWNRVAEINATARMLVENPQALRANVESSELAWKGMLQEYADAWNVSFEEAAVVAYTQSTYLWTHWAQWRSVKTKQDARELKNVIIAWYSIEPMKSDIRHPVTRALYDPEFIAWIDDVLKSVPTDEVPQLSDPKPEEPGE